MNRKKILKFLAHFVGYLVMSVFFLYWTFPTTAARHATERMLGNKGYPTEVEGLSLNGLSGVTLSDITVELPPKALMGAQVFPEKVQKKQQKVVHLLLDSLSFNTDTIGLVRNLPVSKANPLSADLSIEAYGGTIEVEGLRVIPGRYKISKLSIRNLDLTKSRLLRAVLPVDLRGRISSKAALRIGPTGKVAAKLSQLKIKNSSIKNLAFPCAGSACPVSDPSLGTIQIKGEVGYGKKFGVRDNKMVVKLDKLEAVGGDIEAVLDGKSSITWSVNQYGKMREGFINVGMAFRITDDYLNRKIQKDGKKVTPNSWIKTALSSDARAKRSRRGDWLGMRCRGSLRPPINFERLCRLQRPSAAVSGRSHTPARKKPKVQPKRPKKKAPSAKKSRRKTKRVSPRRKSVRKPRSRATQPKPETIEFETEKAPEATRALRKRARLKTKSDIIRSKKGRGRARPLQPSTEVDDEGSGDDDESSEVEDDDEEEGDDEDDEDEDDEDDEEDDDEDDDEDDEESDEEE